VTILSLFALLAGLSTAQAQSEPLALDLKQVEADHAAAAVARSTRSSVVVLDRGRPFSMQRQFEGPQQALDAIAQAAGLQLTTVQTSGGALHLLTAQSVAGLSQPSGKSKDRATLSLERVDVPASTVIQKLRATDKKARWEGGTGTVSVVLYELVAAEVAQVLQELGPAGGAPTQPRIECKERLPSVQVPCVPIDELGLWGLVDGRRPVAIVRAGSAAALVEDGEVLGEQVLAQGEAERWTLYLNGERPSLRLTTLQTRSLVVGGAVPSLCEAGEDTRFLCTLEDRQSLALCNGPDGHTVRIGLSTQDRWYWFATHDTDGTVLTMDLGEELAEVRVSGHLNKATIRGRRVAGQSAAWSVQDNDGSQACSAVYIDELLPQKL